MKTAIGFVIGLAFLIVYGGGVTYGWNLRKQVRDGIAPDNTKGWFVADEDLIDVLIKGRN